jgi:hypothetical protein
MICRIVLDLFRNLPEGPNRNGNQNNFTTQPKPAPIYPSPYPSPAPYKASQSFSAPCPRRPHADSNPNTAYKISLPAASVLFSPAPRPNKEMAVHILASQQSHLHTGQSPRPHHPYSCSSAQPSNLSPPAVDPKLADPVSWTSPYPYFSRSVSSQKAHRQAGPALRPAAHLRAAAVAEDCSRKDPAPGQQLASPEACKLHPKTLQPNGEKLHLRTYGAIPSPNQPWRGVGFVAAAFLGGRLYHGKTYALPQFSMMEAAQNL